ncbi:uncharacterized protein LOC113089574 [Carassius auratus]|uniref:Uncharacterized protein LOC113089574 n=1 Tax=Carassius auratus TaxID=7957 RepID=A0A6P6NSF2_CARAU|nr:uncharacterized protein LOC113089574 [Carassius auratus]
MPRKGRRSQAQKVRWTKLELTGQTSVSKDVAQVSDGQQYEDGDNTPRVISVQASHCQSDARYDVFSRNTQCTCVALTFLVYHSEGTSFEQPDLDRVLEEGDALYVGIKMQLIAEGRFRQDLLSMAEVPLNISTSNHNYSVQKSEVVMGYLRDRGTQEMDAWWIPLDERLQCLSTDVSHALLIVSPECFAVFRDRSGRYGYFDSHSRTAEGWPHPTGDGTAVMLTFTNLHDMTNRLLELFWNRGPQACYEFMAVSFEMEQQSEEPCSSAACVSTSQVTCSVPETQTTADIRIPENLVLTDNKKQNVIKVLKTNKQRRRKELRKIASKKQEATLEKTARHFEVRGKKREYEREKYATNLHFQKKKMEGTKKKYDQDPFARFKKLECMAKKYKTDVVFQKKKKDYMVRRYKTDDFFQRKMKDYMFRRYKTDHLFQKKIKNYMDRRYHTDAILQKKKKEYMVRRYKTDHLFQKKMKDYMVRRYHTDALFQKKMKDYMVRRYHTDALFQKKKKDYMVRRYHTDALFQKKMKDYMARRYAGDSEFRSHHILRCTLQKKQKCFTDAGFHILHKLRCALRIKRKYRPYIRSSQDIPNSDATNQSVSNSLIQKAISAFRCQILHGPTFICTVCHRALFPNQVKMCNRTQYVKNVHITAFCLTGKYVHACDSACSVPCAVPDERRQEWICHTCDSHLKRGSMPSIAAANRLELPPIPAELLELNVLERQLIAKIVPFAKIVALPKGQQRSVYGAVVCVPSEVEKTVNCLPRPNSESQLLQVKLKRHIKFRGYQHFHTVNMHNVLAALAKLKAMHSEYRDISISDATTFQFLPDDELHDTEEKQEVVVSEQDEQHVSTEEKDELRPGLTLDTCMQPLDIGQDLLSYGEGIFSIAPAQGKKPVGFFKVPKLEAMAFPVQFPTGQNTIDEARQVALSPSMYFNARLFCVDTRFAKDQSYLFFAQFVTETHMARNSMSIQLRKGKPVTKDGRRISNKLLQDDLEVERLVHSRDATRFMQPLRGTPSYWEKTLRDLQAMIRQLGNPTFFCTFSAAEMRWPEVITAIKAQQGEEVAFSELDWTTKCEILRSNPVTVMRMFEKRVDALMNHLLLSPAQPIGEVEDYFYRVEFQARGSPHIHLLAWVKGAPEFENQSDQVVCDFIDRYITCQLPDPTTDPELHQIVTEVQLHSKKHSKSCKKGNVLCRYGFPKLPMSSTTITRPRPQRPEEDENEDQHHQERKKRRQDAPQRPEEDENEDQHQQERKKRRQDAARKAMKEARNKLKPVWDLFKRSPGLLRQLVRLADQM